MRRELFGPGVLFVLIFPCVGLAVVLCGIRSGLKRVHLLQNGIFAEGTIESKQRTSMRVNRNTVYRLQIKFIADDGNPHVLSTKAYQPQALDETVPQGLFYDPMNTQNAFLTAKLPFRLQLDQFGDFSDDRSNKAVLSLLVPAVVIIGHAMYALTRFLL